MLGQRIITAVILLALLLGALIWLPRPAWNALVGLLALAAAWEWTRLAGFAVAGKAAFLICLAALYAILVGWIPMLDFYSSAAVTEKIIWVAALFWLVIVPLWLARSYKARHPLPLALTGFVVILPAAMALVLLPRPYELLALMATVWIADTAAYFAGRAFGKHKLAPHISPGKTWEGVAGALIATAVYAEVLQRAGFSFSFAGGTYSSGTTLLLLLLACAGIVGDLFESWMKRVAGVKDSGNILPGHGGVLDRIDALTSSLPLAALAYALMEKTA